MNTAPAELDLLVNRLRAGPAALEPIELERLLGAATLLREVETGMAGPIRVLEHVGAVILAEQTLEQQPVARVVASVEAADALIADRLAVYERMWDGCGCKVRYFD